MKIVSVLLKIAGVLVGLLALLLIGAAVLLNTSWLQQKMLAEATLLLKEKLQTDVKIDSVSIDLLTLDAELYGLSIDDLQQRKLLRLDFLKADVDIWALVEKEIRISEAKVEGIRAELHKVRKDSLSPDTVANFQFIVDAFKSKKKAPKSRPDSVKREKLTFMLNRLRASRIDVTYNEDSVSLGSLTFTMPRHGTPRGRVENLRGCWERRNKKGQLVTNSALITALEYQEKDGERLIDLTGVNFRTNNHAPRKNTSKPKRGFFDVGHFNIWADMKLAIDRIEDGTVHGWLRECTARDTITGIDIRKLQCEVTANKEGMRLEDVQVQQGDILLKFVRADMHFPNKKTGKRLSYFTSTISGTAYLKDISRPFAPVLKKFSLPLNLSVRMDGNDEGMNFHDVVVTRPNGKLTIKAKGYIRGLKNKYDLKVHFDVTSMRVLPGEPERIINQFAVKKFMMKQLNALGTITYNGSFNVLWKKEEFMGVLNTRAGALNFYFALDENNKYLYGNASTKHLKLGEVMDMPDLGPVTANANFKFDISKPRTALMRRRLGGKLPIGEVTAHVDEGKYKFVKGTNIDAKIVSDGAVAEGYIYSPGKFADLNCTFSFTNTNEMKKTKIKPGIHFNLFSKSSNDPDKKEKQIQKLMEKQDRMRQKEAEKEAKAKEKAARKAAKAEEKAARDEQKAKEKAAKAEEKAARKAAKAEEKAARKAAKAAEKAARKAAREQSAEE